MEKVEKNVYLVMAPSKREYENYVTMLDFTETVKELNKTIKAEVQSTKRFSWAFLAFGFVQVIVAIIALAVDVLGEAFFWPRVWLLLFALGGCFYVFREFLSEKNF